MLLSSDLLEKSIAAFETTVDFTNLLNRAAEYAREEMQK
jgi:hypothetical protein